MLAHYYGTRVADGFFHSFSGWVIYIAAAVLLFATGWVVDRFASRGIKDREMIYKMNRITKADLAGLVGLILLILSILSNSNRPASAR